MDGRTAATQVTQASSVVLTGLSTMNSIPIGAHRMEEKILRQPTGNT